MRGNLGHLKSKTDLVEVSGPEDFVRDFLGHKGRVVLPDMRVVHHKIGDLALTLLQITNEAAKKAKRNYKGSTKLVTKFPGWNFRRDVRDFFLLVQTRIRFADFG